VPRQPVIRIFRQNDLKLIYVQPSAWGLGSLTYVQGSAQNVGGGGNAPASSPVAGRPAAPPSSGGGPGLSKSTKRGVAYDLATEQDMAARAPGVSWRYDWGLRPNIGAPSGYATRFGMDLSR